MFSAVGFSITLNLPSPIVGTHSHGLDLAKREQRVAVDNTLINEQFVAM